MLPRENVEALDLVNALFDQIKADHDLKSDSALARHIGVPDMYVYRWRRGEFAISLRVLAPLLVHYSPVIAQVKIAT